MLTPSESDRLCVVLVSTRNPLNIGAVARAMQNFGFKRLRVVNPYEAAFREARSAVGAFPLLKNAEEFKSVASAIADCTLVVGTTAPGYRQIEHPDITLENGAPIILKELGIAPNLPNRVAILFGSEKSGLSNEHLSYCHWRMHVATGEEQPSMNLGQAVAVCLYELTRGTAAAHPPDTPAPASAEEMERITAVLLDSLDASGYLAIRPSADKENSVRRMVRRLNLSAEDVPVWLGMLRQIIWKLRNTP
ncbi:MAG: RNA methyltransferase [Acidobacteriaceae bacterium]